MKLATHLLATVAAATLLALPASAADVTFERLLNADEEPHNQLMQWRNYSGHNYSPLDQINSDNVGDLRVAFIQQLAHKGLDTYEQFIPLVEDGFMYVGNGDAMIYKFDVRSGDRAEQVWMFDPEREDERRGRLRGAALLNDSLYFTVTNDGRLIRLDKETGEVIFDVNIRSNVEAPMEYGRGPGNDVEGETFSATVVALEDRIIVQQARSGGWRSWIAAHDAETGDVLWRWWVVPGPDAPGHETWTDDWNAYVSGGGSAFNSGSYDPETNFFIVGTGDPSPWGNPEFRPGDNLYSLSTVALDAETGELQWYFQEIPNEAWDYDTVGVRQFYDVEVGGESRNAVGFWSRNGFYYTLDRVTGEFLFAEPFTEVTWTEGLDVETGLPVEYDPNLDLQTYAGHSQRFGDLETGQDVCPHHGGTPTFWPSSFDEERRISYQAGATGTCADYVVTTELPEEEHFGRSTGGTWAHARHEETVGFVRGVDVDTGEVVQEHIMEYPNSSGVLATAGNVLFSTMVDGRVFALDKESFEELWSFNTGKVPNAGLVTYMADDKQYVAALLGGRLRTDFHSVGLQPELAEISDMSQGAPALLVVFTLDE